jgi:hypothetical protein
MLSRMFDRLQSVLSRLAPSSSPPEGDVEGQGDILWTEIALSIFGAIAFLSLALYSVFGATQLNAPEVNWVTRYLGLLGTLVAVGFAAFAVGGFLGFLFGIPKSNRERNQPNARTTNQSPDENAYLNNTNLEEMSDWLTKIIVGAGLVGLKDLADYFNSAMGHMATKLQGAPFAALIVGADAVGFAILGFFTLYLLTRLFLAGAFTRAEAQLRIARRQAEKTANLDMSDMSAKEKEWLTKIIRATEGPTPTPLTLDSTFRRESPDHQALRSLRNRLITATEPPGRIESGKTIVLTPLAKSILGKLKEAVNFSPVPV